MPKSALHLTHACRTSMCPWVQEQSGEAPTEASGKGEAEAHLTELYGELLRAPPEGARAALAPGQARLGIGSAEGALALGEGVRALLGGPVEFAHKAHHRLLPVRAGQAFSPGPPLFAISGLLAQNAHVQGSCRRLVLTLDMGRAKLRFQGGCSPSPSLKSSTLRCLAAAEALSH